MRLHYSTHRATYSLAGVIAAVAVATAALADAARAQLIDCRDSVTGMGYQIYFDELTFTTDALKSDPQLQSIMNRLAFKYQSRAEDIGFSFPTARLLVHVCGGRKPAGESEFTTSALERLDENDVILEVWGVLDARREADGSLADRRARIACMLVPVLMDEDAPDRRDAGRQFIEYPKDSTQAVTDLADLLEQSQELEAYIAVTLGVNMARNGEYDDAVSQLCMAQIMLAASPTSGDRGPAALLGYIQRTWQAVVEKARSDPDYEGPLREQQEPCTR